MVNRVRALLLFTLSILISEASALSPDICELCKRAAECPQFGEMSREQQQKWIQKYPCQAANNAGGRAVPGFSTVAKGDYVCCPSNQVWSIKEDDAKTPAKAQNSGDRTNQNSFYIPPYLLYPNKPSINYNSANSEQPRVQNQRNNNYGLPQCMPQATPPAPESGCCGVDMSDSDRITDVEEFLQFKTTSSNFERQYNAPRSPKTSREKRKDDIKSLGVTFETRIAGGHQSALDQYPWTVYLLIQFINKGNKLTNFACGGSLISSGYILTAAHCLVNGNDQLSRIEATLAEYDKRIFPTDCVTMRGGKRECIINLRIPVDNVIIHNNFIEDYLINDIALLRLRDIAPYTRYIRPICLPPINIDSPKFSNLQLAAAGWGLNMSVESDVKQFSFIQMVPKDKCRIHYSRLTEGHLCAAGKRNEDTCKGDSGGPLMMLYRGKYFVVGIVSGKTSASRCGTPVPSLYTNVYAYLDWIKYYAK